ncbi:MAG: FAD-binding oxidoreductase [Schleiferiaceae bacterium]|nr:FAD-binding oxidoreductase [Schleiferiaceae bacterium]
MLSYWERSSFIHHDLIIVGSGLVGLSTALHYQLAHPKKKVAVIERGLFPSGASTKNAGFVCFGSISELAENARTDSQDELLSLVEKRYKGGLELRQLLGDKHIDYCPVGGYELDFQGDLHERMFTFNDWLRPLFKRPVFSDARDNIPAFSFKQTIVKGLVKNQFEGSIDTGKMMDAFARKAREAGVQFYTQTEVLHYVEQTNGVEVAVSTAEGSLQLFTGQLALCTNAFTKALLPEADLEPGRGMVLVTKPLTWAPPQGTFHYHSGYNYFRNAGNRILLGGARHLDLKGETTTKEGVNALLEEQLIVDLKNFIAPDRPLEIDYAWSGIMAFGEGKAPLLLHPSSRVHAAVRLGGMGVALGTGLGKELAQRLRATTS